MIDVLGWPTLSQRRHESRLIPVYTIINGLAQVPFEGVLVEAYQGTRRKHKHTGLAFAEAPSVAVFRSFFNN